MFPVFASATANTADTTITNLKLDFFVYSDFINPRAKYNTTPVYLYITDSGYSDIFGVFVKAFGYNSDSDNADLTLSNGRLTKNGVLCSEGVKQSIRTLIYERNYFKATLQFRSGYTTGDTIFSAKWSPDSTREYTIAE